jgi:hypothetical protein
MYYVIHSVLYLSLFPSGMRAVHRVHDFIHFPSFLSEEQNAHNDDLLRVPQHPLSFLYIALLFLPCTLILCAGLPHVSLKPSKALIGNRFGFVKKVDLLARLQTGSTRRFVSKRLTNPNLLPII